MADHELSDEQLHKLLQDAAERFKTAEAGSFQIQSPRMPSLQKMSHKSTSQKSITPCVQTNGRGAQVDPSYLVKPEERKLSNGIRRVDDAVMVKRKSGKEQKANAGSSWYNLPRTVLTPELKRDIQLLRSRSVLDPHRHYKKESAMPRIPEFSQVGTIIQGPTEFFSARLSNKDRKQTFVEEVMAGESSTQKFRSKYNQIQAAKTSGRKEHYKKMKAMRRKGRPQG